MESYKCDVCAKSFTGLVCFQQHEASEKHKKKVCLLNGAITEVPKLNNPDQFHCPACMLSISGLDNYQKHVISLEHALNVQKKNGDLLSQSLSSTFQLKTERNQLMESSVSSASPMKVLAPFAECKPCQKQFSGPEPYQQHLVSAGHKKKCPSSNDVMQRYETSFSSGNENINNNSLQNPQSSLTEGDLNKMKAQTFLDQSVSNTIEIKTERNQLMESSVSLASPMKVLAPFAECKPCQKQFSGPEPYQQHLVSAGHKKKCPSSNDGMQMYETSFSSGYENINNNSLQDPQSCVSESDLNKVVLQPFARCDICKMEFNGALPYQLHLVSDSHKKQASDRLLRNTCAETQNEFKCDICDMKFSGPVPHQQHLVSIGHNKKMNAAGLSRQLTTTRSLPLPDSTFKQQPSMTDIQKWYCNICKKQCSGPIPYHTHILSRDHLKNVRILEVEENLRKIKELGPFACLGNDENDFSQVTSTADLHSELKSEMGEMFMLSEINDLNINVKSEDTKILSDKFQINANDLIALSNLNIIPPEKLDVSVFRPDDEVVFSSPKKCKQEFLADINKVKKVCDNEKFNEIHRLMVE